MGSVSAPIDPFRTTWAPPSSTGPGSRASWTPPEPMSSRPPLRRATANSSDMPTPWMAGVCSGFAVHSGIDVVAVRWMFVVLSLLGGAGALLYFWLWVMVPKDEGVSARGRGSTIAPGLGRPVVDRSRITVRNQLLLAGVLIIVGTIVVSGLTWAGVASLRDLLATVAVIAGIGLVWSQGANLSSWRSGRFLSIVAAGVVLLFIGSLALVGRGDPPLILLRGGLIGAVISAGVLFALAPLWLRTSKDLSASQAQQVRDAERADIAAHLHDSVLQTLTLIRASSDDPKRVRALALAEERELRSWLYAGRSEAATSLAEAVRETVGALEGKYGVPVDVVAVSDARPGPAELALVAALGEAVANAVRHGEPPVSVYVEARPDRIEAFIKDSGAGFDIDAVPADRHGVRDSIIGRMETVGGTARIRCLASGTEVALALPRTTDQAPEGAPIH